MSAARLLLVEDDDDIVQLLDAFLQEHGFEVCTASSVEKARAAMRQRDFDLLLLDVMLPGEDGLSFCRDLRTQSDVPVIFLTALGDDGSRIQGLERGADDYVCKPFNPRELVARINAVLRRARGQNAETRKTKAYRFEGWRLDLVARELFTSGGERCVLTSTEFDLLLALCQKAGIPMSREKLLDASSSGGAGQIERSVDVHISRLRQKIEENPRDPRWIKTVRLGGYVFTPEVVAE